MSNVSCIALHCIVCALVCPATPPPARSRSHTCIFLHVLFFCVPHSRHNHQMQDDAEESSSGGSSPNPYEDDGHKYGEHPSAGGVGVGVGGMDHDMMAPQQQQQGGQVALDENGDPQPLYCYCQQVSFGEMVGCDGEHCRFEWFHYACVGLKRPPKGKWYCEDCRRTLGR